MKVGEVVVVRRETGGGKEERGGKMCFVYVNLCQRVKMTGETETAWR